MKTALPLLITMIFALAGHAYAQTTNGMSMKDFELNIQQLQGKSPSEAFSKLGKPKDVDKSFAKDVGTIECHLYEGIKDLKSGAIVSAPICFKNGKLHTQPSSIVYRF